MSGSSSLLTGFATQGGGQDGGGLLRKIKEKPQGERVCLW